MAIQVSVFGMGYVGCVSAACLANAGHTVVGVDVNPVKVDEINAGKSPIVEDRIGDLVRDGVASGRLRATLDPEEAVYGTEISLIAVGTPGRPNGSLDLRYVERVCEQIGGILRFKSDRHTVVVRSTILPGTTHDVVIPVLEACSGRSYPDSIAVCFNPEFLREGTSVADYYDPPFTLIGTEDDDIGRQVAELYSDVDAPIRYSSIRVAEMVKYACNAFHAVKITYANEIGSLCKATGVDSHQVMDIFCEDTKLNISSRYLTPGFAFGGSCLPKDLRALMYKGKEVDVETPMLGAVIQSNRLQIERAADMVLRLGKRKIGVLGISFKAGTDDLRESPLVSLVEILIGKGMELTIYDRDVSRANIVGANREYIEREIPHIWSLVRESIDEVVQHAETLVVGNRTAEFRQVASRIPDNVKVVDLSGMLDGPMTESDNYHGICW
jgi:GDP-mannose 6-dehydrogenase